MHFQGFSTTNDKSRLIRVCNKKKHQKPTKKTKNKKKYETKQKKKHPTRNCLKESQSNVLSGNSYLNICILTIKRTPNKELTLDDAQI